MKRLLIFILLTLLSQVCLGQRELGTDFSVSNYGVDPEGGPTVGDLHSDEQLKKMFGFGVYDEKEFYNNERKYKDHIAFWYGLKNYQAKNYRGAFLSFLSYTQQTNDAITGNLGGGHVMLAIQNYKKAEEFYSNSLKAGDSSQSEKGLAIAYAMQRNKDSLRIQIDKLSKMFSSETNPLKRVSYIRIIIPALIYLREKNEFEAIVKNLDETTLMAYQDLALNCAKGIEVFKLDGLSKKSDIVINKLKLNLYSVPSASGVLILEPDGVDRNTLMRSMSERIASVVFDINAAGWGDCYDLYKE